MSHPRELLTYFRDPGIRRGPLRVLPRTDGTFIVFDERRPLGRGAVAEDFRTPLDAARRLLELALEQGIAEDAS